MEKLSLSFFFMSSLCVFLAPPSLANNDINSWCNQTPYPDPCKHFMGHFAPTQKSEFHKMAVQTAMERALVLAQSHAQWLQPQSGDELGNIAWADCQILYENTIFQLNWTLSKADCTDFDQQTWLLHWPTLRHVRLDSLSLVCLNLCYPLCPTMCPSLLAIA